MTRPIKRRFVALDDLDALLTEVERLGRGKYARAGNWDLGQACDHLATVFDSTMSTESIDFKVPKLLRLVGPLVLPIILTTGRFPPGQVEAPAVLLPAAVVDQASAVERFRGAIGRLKAFPGPFPRPHPVFGRLSDATWRKLHLVHAAHHLGFLVPADG